MERIEERIAWLERHVTEQDKVMLAQGDAIAGLRRELLALRARHEDGGSSPPGDQDDRPPHY